MSRNGTTGFQLSAFQVGDKVVDTTNVVPSQRRVLTVRLVNPDFLYFKEAAGGWHHWRFEHADPTDPTLILAAKSEPARNPEFRFRYHRDGSDSFQRGVAAGRRLRTEVPFGIVDGLRITLFQDEMDATHVANAVKAYVAETDRARIARAYRKVADLLDE